jgi:hypothetical protein
MPSEEFAPYVKVYFEGNSNDPINRNKSYLAKLCVLSLKRSFTMFDSTKPALNVITGLIRDKVAILNSGEPLKSSDLIVMFPDKSSITITIPYREKVCAYAICEKVVAEKVRTFY